MSDQNELAAYRAELEALRAAERAEVAELKAEFIRKFEELLEQLKAEFARSYDKYTKRAELAHLRAVEPVRDAPPLCRRKPPVQ